MSRLSQLGALKGVLLEAAELADRLGGVDVQIELVRLVESVDEEIEAERGN